MIRVHILIAMMTLATGCLCQAALAHAFLDHADPKVGATLKAAPTEIRVWFNDDIAPAKSDIQVFDSAGKEIDKKDSHGDSNDKTLLIVSVPPLSPGRYKVIWHAVCLDAHHTSAEFQFTLKP